MIRPTHLPLSRVAGCAIAAALLTVSPGAAQLKRTVVFQALDAVGRAPFPGLEAGDVQVQEGIEILPVSSLRFGASPMDVALLFDTGRASFLTSQLVALGARLACSELEEGDRLAMITFSSKQNRRFPFVSGGRDLGVKIERALGGGDHVTDIKVFDGIKAALELFPPNADSSRSRAVVIVSNSVDKGSAAGQETILAKAREKGAALFAVSVPILWESKDLVRDRDVAGPSKRFTQEAQRAADQFRPLAERTGGEAQVLLVNGYTLRQILERIRWRYVGSYDSPSGGRIQDVRLSPEAAARLPNLLFRGAW